MSTDVGTECICVSRHWRHFHIVSVFVFVLMGILGSFSHRACTREEELWWKKAQERGVNTKSQEKESSSHGIYIPVWSPQVLANIRRPISTYIVLIVIKLNPLVSLAMHVRDHVVHTLALKPMTKADLQKRLNKGVWVCGYGLVLSDKCGSLHCHDSCWGNGNDSSICNC